MADQLENLERLRLTLEQNIAKLKKALVYWQTWEYEHEGFKDELEIIEHEPDAEEMLKIGQDLELEIVDDKEIEGLLNYGKKPSRSRAQVITQINGRVETGRRNASTLQKQLEAAEEKLEKVLLVAEPVTQSENGEELMDIFEELDDGGNVVSSQVVNAAKDGNELKQVLAGKGLVEEDESVSDMAVSPASSKGKDEMNPAATPPMARVSEQLDRPDNTALSAVAAKTEIPKAPPPSKLHPTQRMFILDDQDNVVDSRPLELVHAKTPIQPKTEDERIAHLREAQANARELAPVVATFDVEPETDSEEDRDSDDDSEWSENSYGMDDIGSQMSSEYRAEMEALVRKHAVAMENAGPDFQSNDMGSQNILPSSSNTALPSNGISTTGKAKAQRTKGVRFAEELDVSPAPATISNQEGDPKTGIEELAPRETPISESIVERSEKITAGLANTGSSSRKPSRFKAALSSWSTAQRPEQADVDSGFILPGAPPQIRAAEEVLAERPKKVSRFKAAKLGE